MLINAGSSSLRFSLLNEKLEQLYRGHLDAIGKKHCQYRFCIGSKKEITQPFRAINHKEAIIYSLKRLKQDGILKDLEQIQKVAHRVVHGGKEFQEPTRINKSILKKLDQLSDLAPLHNPANLEAVKACMKVLPRAEHFAIFDTAFHSSLPEKAFLYGLPFKMSEKDGIRRYGFHGTSHSYVAEEAKKILKNKKTNLITCHIGNGVSVCAIKNGRSVDTSMGFTPLEGPVMGTRSGTIDPGIIFHLMRKGLKASKIEEILVHESGFKGLSGISSDIRDLWAKPKSAGTKRTFAVFSYQMAKLIASYFIPLDGPPAAIIFTAGIGENAYYLRKQICDYLKPFGLSLNAVANQENRTVISNPKSKIKVLVIPTDEAKQMAKLVR